jgi:DNA (cytosine-5)-methyltransferase 1
MLKLKGELICLTLDGKAVHFGRSNAPEVDSSGEPELPPLNLSGTATITVESDVDPVEWVRESMEATLAKTFGAMTYGSVCSGIEAASVAWHPLGWTPAWFAEIEKFPAAVLDHHFPQVPNLGDMTKIAAAVRTGITPAPDVLVGGTPCQAFSIAGLGQSLKDPRGQLTLSYVDIANAIDEKRAEEGKDPAIHVWENVPGSLSTKDNAFGYLLAGLAGESEPFTPGERPEQTKSSKFWRWNKDANAHVVKWPKSGCVYGRQRRVAWRILDAQYLGVAQRRSRVFVVASARNEIDPAEILFEFDGVRRDSPPSRKPGAQVAAAATEGTRNGSHWDSELNPHPTLNQSHNTGGIGASNQEVFAQRGSGLVAAFGGGNCSGSIEIAACLTAKGQRNDFDVETFAVQSATGEVSHTLTAEGHDASEDGTGRGTPVVAIHGTQDPDVLVENAHTIGRNQGQENAIVYALQDVSSRDKAQNGKGWNDEGTSYTIDTAATQGVALECYPISTLMALRGPTTSNSSREGIGIGNEGDPGFTLQSAHGHAVAHVAFAENSRGEVRLENGDGQISGALSTGGGKPGQGCPTVLTSFDVRRLTPKECERLQGFPDGWTLIPEKKRNTLKADELAYLRKMHPDMPEDEADRLAADGPRYKAIGNSMAVPVMQWIGARIGRAVTAAADVAKPEVCPDALPQTQTENADSPPTEAYGFQTRVARNGRGDMGDVCHTLTAEAGETGTGDSAPCVAYPVDVPKAEIASAIVAATGGRQRPFLKWAGGKYKYLDVIAAVMPKGDRLIEPFVGAGSVFMNMGFKNNLLADVNPDLINLYRQLEERPDKVIMAARELVERCTSNSAYENIRDKFNEREAPAARHAALFLAMLRTCFNGLCRYNKKGIFNVGWCKKVKPKPYFPEQELAHFAASKQHREFICGSFEETIARAGAGDVVFCDPPYEPMPGENGFTAYTKGAFDFEHQVALVEACIAAHGRGARIVITNSGAPNIKELYRKHGFKVQTFTARRAISCDASTRGDVDDIIAIL